MWETDISLGTHTKRSNFIGAIKTFILGNMDFLWETIIKDFNSFFQKAVINQIYVVKSQVQVNKLSKHLDKKVRL